MTGQIMVERKKVAIITTTPTFHRLAKLILFAGKIVGKW
jgi:hypothetical protein